MTATNNNDNTANPNPELYWRNRRHMGWTGLVFSIFAWTAGFVASLFLPESAVSAIHPIASTGIWSGMALTFAYFTGCAAEDVSAILKRGKL